jgi:hypothetical protein
MADQAHVERKELESRAMPKGPQNEPHPYFILLSLCSFHIFPGENATKFRILLCNYYVNRPTEEPLPEVLFNYYVNRPTEEPLPEVLFNYYVNRPTEEPLPEVLFNYYVNRPTEEPLPEVLFNYYVNRPTEEPLPEAACG